MASNEQVRHEETQKEFNKTINDKIVPLALRSGIGIKELYHYTLHDLMLEIMFRQERDRKLVWELGARVLEAIGVAFSKHGKYSQMPEMLSQSEIKERQEKAFNDWAERAVRMFKR